MRECTMNWKPWRSTTQVSPNGYGIDHPLCIRNEQSVALTHSCEAYLVFGFMRLLCRITWYMAAYGLSNSNEIGVSGSSCPISHLTNYLCVMLPPI